MSRQRRTRRTAKATGSGNGYQQFIFCRISNDLWAFHSNASKQYVTTYASDYWVQADGNDPAVYDTWYVCALDLGRDLLLLPRQVHGCRRHFGPLHRRGRAHTGRGNLFYRSQFGGASLPGC
jgi:hypothetical protein